MRSKMWVLILTVAVSLAVTRPAAAQDEGFTATYTDVGPVIGLGGIAGADFAFGVRVEKGIMDLPNLGNGVLGVQVGFDYYHYDFDVFNVLGDSNVSVIPISVMANYHLRLDNRKLDPFLGVGLVYTRVNFNFNCGPVVNCDVGGDGVGFGGHAGLRYFVSPKMAAYFEVGSGAATLNVGLMFKIGGN